MLLVTCYFRFPRVAHKRLQRSFSKPLYLIFLGKLSVNAERTHSALAGQMGDSAVGIENKNFPLSFKTRLLMAALTL